MKTVSIPKSRFFFIFAYLIRKTFPFFFILLIFFYFSKEYKINVEKKNQQNKKESKDLNITIF